ncbi:MAG: 50S ribosomal protein L21 [Rhodobacteraceae bacterium]|nr:MAG: 50S ribosomal protein L21 [Paracoccaceae bacterium]
MFAVLKTGGKQYKVVDNDVIIVEKLSAEEGDLVQFEKIMMIGDKKVEVGTPDISGAAVHAEVLEQIKSKKVISFVKRRRKHSSQRKRGHRQNLTVLKVREILAAGAKDIGKQIEAGVSIIGSNGKAGNKSAAKAVAVKKPALKTETAKNPAAKAVTEKKPALKTEIAKKPAAKAVTAKKPAAKAVTAKKPAAKMETAKKPAAKAKTAKKSDITDKK